VTQGRPHLKYAESAEQLIGLARENHHDVAPFAMFTRLALIETQIGIIHALDEVLDALTASRRNRGGGY